MAKSKVTGLDVFVNQMTQLNADADKINRGALGEGAKLAALKMKAAIEALPVREDKPEHGRRLYGVTRSEKAQILNNFGIARFRGADGGWNTSIGFTGYVNTPSPKFNDHVPTGMLVQCVNYGTQFRRATHTLDKADKDITYSVSEAMQKYIEDKTKEIIGG